MSAAAAAARLRERGERVATVEGTSGGLVAAALQAVPRASSFFLGGIVVYSRHAARALLPPPLMRRLGRAKDNYADAPAYRASKRVFAVELARWARESMGADWGVAESGATDVSTLPPRLRGAGAFSCVAVVGPGGFELVEFVDVAGKSRKASMLAFAAHALTLLERAVREAPPEGGGERKPFEKAKL